ncbi:hypothetical protein EDB85DRAFT_1868608, partial [Lactarius pseudohatsudake]
DFFIPSFQCPHHLKRVGVLGDGGRGRCGMGRNAKQEKCVIYSFGASISSLAVGEEADDRSRTGIWGHDYSVNSWGPEITGDPELRDRAHFKTFALGGPRAGRTTTTTIRPRGISGRRFIEILKIDIDGGEFDALTAFLSARAAEGSVRPVGQLQFEIHA